MTQKPYLNLGCGTIILPAERPAHHSLITSNIHQYALWHNVDRNEAPGVDECVDLFTYPWPWPDNSYDGALLSHLMEHVPHETCLANGSVADYLRLNNTQDGWFAFLSELYRVLTPGAIAHFICPHGRSDGALGDPSHTRYLTPATFTHSIAPNPDAAFKYATGGIHFRIPEPPLYSLHPDFGHLMDKPEQLQHALDHQWNVAVDFYVQLEAVKDAG